MSWPISILKNSFNLSNRERKSKQEDHTLWSQYQEAVVYFFKSPEQLLPGYKLKTKDLRKLNHVTPVP